MFQYNDLGACFGIKNKSSNFIQMKIVFQLVKAARGSGGDRYSAKHDGKEWTVYFLQSISRSPDGSVKKVIKMDIEE